MSFQIRWNRWRRLWARSTVVAAVCSLSLSLWWDTEGQDTSRWRNTFFWAEIFSLWREIPEQLKLWLLYITGSLAVSVTLLTFFSPISPSQRKDKLREHMQRMHNPEREAKKADRISRSKTFKPRIASTDYESFMFKCRLCMMGFRRRGMLVSAWVLLQPLYSILMNR